MMGAFDELAKPAGGEVTFASLAGASPAPTTKAPKSRAEMQQEFASRQGTPETAARYGVTSGDVGGVPKWGRDHPNLYGLYGAAKGVANAVVEGAGAAGGTAGGAALGALTPVPGGAIAGGIAGGGAGYAGAKRLSQAVGLSDEPMDNSAAAIGKDVAIGAVMGAVPAAAGLVGKGIRALAPGGETAMNLLTKVPIGAPAEMLAAAKAPDAAALNAAIDKGITKAIRPGVASGRTAAQAEQYANNARTAVKEIVLNKDNLGLTNEFGETVDGLPQNLQQFRQAVDTTKKSLWDRVEAINKAAGGPDVQVPLQPAVEELNALSNHAVYRTMSPETAGYAASVAKRLGGQGAFSVEDAQSAISMANQSLKNFYSNPSVDTASRAYIDSMVANNLRSGLDAALESATGSAAAPELRQSYGALKAIEKDVNQRATVDARKNTKGLIDFSDIYTAGELVKAMATLNPVGAAKTGAMAAVKAYIKRANDPNNIVKEVFKAADKLVSPVDFPLPGPATVVPVAPIPLTGGVNAAGIDAPAASQMIGGNLAARPIPPTPHPMTGGVNSQGLQAPSRAVQLSGGVNSLSLQPPTPASQLTGGVNSGRLVSPQPSAVHQLMSDDLRIKR